MQSEIGSPCSTVHPNAGALSVCPIGDDGVFVCRLDSALFLSSPSTTVRFAKKHEARQAALVAEGTHKEAAATKVLSGDIEICVII